MKTPRSRRHRLLPAAGMLIALPALLELALRLLFMPGLTHQRYLEPDVYRWSRLRSSVETEAATFPVATIFSPLSRHYFPVRVNAQGMRSEREYAIPKPAGVLRVLCLGDSVTFGWGLPEKHTYPRLLEGCLTDLGERVEALNGGVPNYSSRQGLVYLDRELWRFQPDVVIIQFGWNDSSLALNRTFGPLSSVTDAELMPGGPGDFEPVRRWARFPGSSILGHSQIVRTAVTLYSVLEYTSRWEIFDHAPESDLPRGSNRVDPDDYRANLQAFAEECAGHGAGLIVIAPVLRPPNYRRIVKEFSANAKIDLVSQVDLFASLAAEPGRIVSQRRFQPAIDRLARMRGREFLAENPEYYLTLDPVHPTEIGNLLTVEELVRTMVPNAGDTLQCPLP